MTSDRIYAISDKRGAILALISSDNKAQALSRFVRGTLSVSLASPAQIIAATKAGIEVDEVSEEEGAPHE